MVFDGTGATGPHGLDAAGLTARGWRVLSGEGRVADPWPLLCGAQVVISHGGQNALAELAAAGARTVVVPQPRPFAEQERTASALAGAGVVVAQSGWAADWPGVLSRAADLDPAAWRRWSHGNGAARAAAALVALR